MLSNLFAARKKAPPVYQDGPEANDEGASTADKSFKVNPFVNLYMRLTGGWPLFGPPDLTEAQYRALFATAPSFVDYFPVVDYLDEDDVYLLDDGINVARFWRVNTRYMCARSDEALERFNAALTQALDALPAEDDYPYVAQLFALNEEHNTIAEDLERAMRENGVIDDPYSRQILEVNRQHAELVSHPKGVFPDSRLTGSEQGWRVGSQSVYLCIYRKCPDKYWKKNNKRSPAEQLKYDLNAFDTAVKNAGLSLESLQPHELVNWLGSYFGSDHDRMDAADYAQRRRLASFDLGQQIFDTQPRYFFSKDERERGIWRFGDSWLRYLTIGAITAPPRDGAITLGKQELDGDSPKIGASLFEELPAGSMMTWTIIPRSDFRMKNEINEILYLSQDGASREAVFATEQAKDVLNEMMRKQRRVYYVQMGSYVRGKSLMDLLDATEVAVSKIKASGCVAVINPRDDVISQDTFVRALPVVYDFAHDRNAALRARKCYTAHLASLLPFYGNKSGSKNPCYIMFTRTGEPFYMNPFHTEDREKVSHELFFGPSGSGKSASICYMAMQSMAVNNPRMFLFDYGNSFKLLGDYMERHGKKVKRFVLSANSPDVLAPFFETQKALAYAEKSQAISAGTWISGADDTQNQDDDEERDYLAEMEYVLRIMVTGGNNHEHLSQSQIAYIRQALIRGLKKSVAAGEPHARPVHMAEAMRELADEEAMREGRLEQIALELRKMADAISLWTDGLHGMLFNRHASGFDSSYDLTIVELGALGKEGKQDMLAVAGLSAIYAITAMAESLQGSGRSIEVKIDEAHLWAKINLLISGLIVGAKVFRKLGCWLNIITQDITDFIGEARKILGNAEFWWLMRMDEKEIRQAEEILNLSEETRHLIRFPRKEERRFVEGVSMSSKFPNTLIRFVPPSLMLALGQTDAKEKEARQRIMREKGISELDAALEIAAQIEAARRSYQKAA